MRNTFEINFAEDGESFKVFLNEEFIISANHDDNGWQGMENVENIVTKIASIIDAKIIYQNQD